MAGAVYILTALTMLLCAILVLLGYARSGKRLLFWSGLCFLGLTISNALVFVDLIVFPSIDLYLLRLASAVVAMVLLLYGLIWENR